MKDFFKYIFGISWEKYSKDYLDIKQALGLFIPLLIGTGIGFIKGGIVGAFIGFLIAGLIIKLFLLNGSIII